MKTKQSILKLLMIAIISVFIFNSTNIAVWALEDEEGLESISLVWYSDINGDVPIGVSRNSDEYRYVYNDSLYRIAKYCNEVVISEYQYDAYGKLIQENKNGSIVVYEYEVNNLGVYTPVAFYIDDDRYIYAYDVQYVNGESISWM